VDAAIVEAFFPALSPIELDMHDPWRPKTELMKKVDRARQQQLERLRYQAFSRAAAVHPRGPDRLCCQRFGGWCDRRLHLLTAGGDPDGTAVLVCAVRGTEDGFCTAIGKAAAALGSKRSCRTNRKALLRCHVDGGGYIVAAYGRLPQNSDCVEGDTTTFADSDSSR